MVIKPLKHLDLKKNLGEFFTNGKKPSPTPSPIFPS